MQSPKNSCRSCGSHLLKLNILDRLICLCPHSGAELCLAYSAAKVSGEEALVVCGQQLPFLCAWQPGHAVDPVTVPQILSRAGQNTVSWVCEFVYGDIETDAVSEALAKSKDYLKRCYANAVVQ